MHACTTWELAGIKLPLFCREHEADDPGQSTLDFSAVVPHAKPESKEQQIPKGPSSHPKSVLVASSGRNRHSYFRARKIQRVCQPV